MAKLKRDLTMSQQLAKGPVDLPFLMLVVLLTGIGVIMVFSASYATAVGEGHAATYYFARQAIFAAVGLAGMAVVSKMNYQHLRWLSVFVLAAAFLMLVLVLIPGFHTVRNDGVRRWLRLPGGFTFQPSEAAKLGVILYFSARMSQRSTEEKRRYDTRTISGALRQKIVDSGFTELVPYVVILLAMIVLMRFEPHMSGTILILVPAAAILFVGGVKLTWCALGVGGAAGLLALIITQTSYMSKRISIWQDPWSDPRGDGFQTIQSLYAIGSGGLFGVGFGQGRQKQGFLPEPENDFVFSNICEELGFVGGMLILILFLLLILRGYWIALHSRDRFGSLLVVGITTLMAAQVFLNIAVVTNLMPVTGVSLPFFSYGGTALLVQLGEMGVVLGVSRQAKAPRQG